MQPKKQCSISIEIVEFYPDSLMHLDCVILFKAKSCSKLLQFENIKELCKNHNFQFYHKVNYKNTIVNYSIYSRRDLHCFIGSGSIEIPNQLLLKRKNAVYDRAYTVYLSDEGKSLLFKCTNTENCNVNIRFEIQINFTLDSHVERSMKFDIVNEYEDDEVKVRNDSSVDSKDRQLREANLFKNNSKKFSDIDLNFENIFDDKQGTSNIYERNTILHANEKQTIDSDFSPIGINKKTKDLHSNSGSVDYNLEKKSNDLLNDSLYDSELENPVPDFTLEYSLGNILFTGTANKNSISPDRQNNINRISEIEPRTKRNDKISSMRALLKHFNNYRKNEYYKAMSYYSKVRDLVKKYTKAYKSYSGKILKMKKSKAKIRTESQYIKLSEFFQKTFLKHERKLRKDYFEIFFKLFKFQFNRVNLLNNLHYRINEKEIKKVLIKVFKNLDLKYVEFLKESQFIKLNCLNDRYFKRKRIPQMRKDNFNFKNKFASEDEEPLDQDRFDNIYKKKKLVDLNKSTASRRSTKIKHSTVSALSNKFGMTFDMENKLSDMSIDSLEGHLEGFLEDFYEKYPNLKVYDVEKLTKDLYKVNDIPIILERNTKTGRMVCITKEGSTPLEKFLLVNKRVVYHNMNHKNDTHKMNNYEEYHSRANLNSLHN